MAILLDPHGDDAVLFAAYTCIRERPYVLVTHPTIPSNEIFLGIRTLGCLAVVWDGEEKHLAEWVASHTPDGRVWAPMIEEEGHGHHNAVGELALELFPDERISWYPTYAPRGQRSRIGEEVVPESNEIVLKLRALSCFESQIEQTSTRPWFYSLLDMREWVA